MRKINKPFEKYWLKEAKKVKWLSVPKKVLKVNKSKLYWYDDGKINIFDFVLRRIYQIIKIKLVFTIMIKIKYYINTHI